jgi:hypothetical protein
MGRYKVYWQRKDGYRICANQKGTIYQWDSTAWGILSLILLVIILPPILGVVRYGLNEWWLGYILPSPKIDLENILPQLVMFLILLVGLCVVLVVLSMAVYWILNHSKILQKETRKV